MAVKPSWDAGAGGWRDHSSIFQECRRSDDHVSFGPIADQCYATLMRSLEIKAEGMVLNLQIAISTYV